MKTGELKWRLRAWALLILGVAYLVLVMATFASAIDLASNRSMQYALHVIVILSAIAYLLFADAIYQSQADKTHARPALLFAALFAVPVLLGRGIGLAAISSQVLFSPDSVFNFYAAASISRAVEMTAWTVLFPLSMAFLARLFFRQWRFLGGLCALSAACCFIAFFSFFSDSLVWLFIGIAGWGVLFIAVIVVYIAARTKLEKA
jgi:hypothetical protein